MLIKLFEDDDIDDLTKEVNEWIAENQIDVIDINMDVDGSYIYIMVKYRESVKK